MNLGGSLEPQVQMTGGGGGILDGGGGHLERLHRQLFCLILNIWTYTVLTLFYISSVDSLVIKVK